MTVICKKCGSTNLSALMNIPKISYTCQDCLHYFVLDIRVQKDRREFFRGVFGEDLGEEIVTKLLLIPNWTNRGVYIGKDKSIVAAGKTVFHLEELKNMDIEQIKKRLRAIGYLDEEEGRR